MCNTANLLYGAHVACSKVKGTSKLFLQVMFDKIIPFKDKEKGKVEVKREKLVAGKGDTIAILFSYLS